MTTSSLPNINKTSPCQAQASFACERIGRERLNPMDMLDQDKAFRSYTHICDTCYEALAIAYVFERHSR